MCLAVAFEFMVGGGGGNPYFGIVVSPFLPPDLEI